MIITPHLLAGAAIATATTTSYPLAFLIGFLSHFVLDAIPHVDPGTFFNPQKNENQSWPLWIYIYAASEFVIIWAIVIFLFQNRPDFDIIITGGIGGITVDILDNHPCRFIRTWPFFKQIHWLHKKFHFELPASQWYLGIPTQIIIIGVCLWILFLKF